MTKKPRRKKAHQSQIDTVSIDFFAAWFYVLPFKNVPALASAVVKTERAAGHADIAELKTALRSHRTPKWRRFAKEVLRRLEANKLTFKVLQAIMHRAAQIAHIEATRPNNPNPFKGSYSDFMIDPSRDWASEKLTDKEIAERDKAHRDIIRGYARDVQRSMREFIGNDGELLRLAHGFIFEKGGINRTLPTAHTPEDMRANINLLLADVNDNSVQIKMARLFFALAEDELKRRIAGSNRLQFIISAIFAAIAEEDKKPTGGLDRLLDRLVAVIAPHRSRDAADLNSKALALACDSVAFGNHPEPEALDLMFAVRWPRPVRLPDPSTNRQLARVAARIGREGAKVAGAGNE